MPDHEVFIMAGSIFSDDLMSERMKTYGLNLNEQALQVDALSITFISKRPSKGLCNLLLVFARANVRRGPQMGMVYQSLF